MSDSGLAVLLAAGLVFAGSAFLLWRSPRTHRYAAQLEGVRYRWILVVVALAAMPLALSVATGSMVALLVSQAVLILGVALLIRAGGTTGSQGRSG